jgi:tetratricopeptide (TPR) repeat protein
VKLLVLSCAAILLPTPDLLATTEPPSCAATAPLSLERAVCQKGLHEWKEAAEAYGAYLRAHPDSLPAALGHSEALLHLGSFIEASQEVRKLSEAYPDDPAVCKAWAWVQANVDKDPRAAEETLTKVTRIAPGDADAWSLLGTFYLDSQRTEEGIHCFDRAVALNSANPLYRAGLARGYAAAGRDLEAGKAFAAALEAAGPDTDSSVFLWYGDFLASAQRFDESIAAYSRAVLVDSGNAEPWMRRAAVEAKAGRYGDAERDVIEARKNGASERKVQTLFVRIYSGSGEDAKAQAAADAAERAASAEEDRRAKWSRARAALQSAERFVGESRYADALPLYVKVTEEIPDYADAWLAAGICYAQTGDAERAERALRAYLRLQPLAAEGHSALGLLLLSKRQFVESRAELQEALRLDPGSTEAKEALDALDAPHAHPDR